jgi:signal transduction histidine kinase
MRTRTTHILFVLLTLVVLFTLDRMAVTVERARRQSTVSRVARDRALVFEAFFQQRMAATRGMALTLGAATGEESETLFAKTARSYLSPIAQTCTAFLMDDQGKQIATWPTADHASAAPLLPETAEHLAELIATAKSTQEPVTSHALELNGRSFGFMALCPLESSEGKWQAVAVVYGIPNLYTTTMTRDNATGAPLAYLIGPEGKVLRHHSDLIPTGEGRLVPITAGNRVWALRVVPASGAIAPIMIQRMVVWGLGIVLILCFSLFQAMLGEKRRALEATSLDIEKQAKAVGEINAKLLLANKELDDFAYTVAHDLKEPIRGIEGLTNMLVEEYAESLDETGREYLNFIHASGERMRGLVDDLLRLSRIARRTYPVESVDLNELVPEVIEGLGYAMRETGAKVDVRGPLPTVECDRVRMSELFQNLLSNALKFTGDAPPHVAIGHEVDGDAHIFYVEDNGLGIPTEEQERVFRIFQRAHENTHTDGSGVGLAICQRIIERHGGRIWVDSKVGEGSRFSFALPPHHSESASKEHSLAEDSVHG